MRRCARKLTLPDGMRVSIMSPAPTSYWREAHGRVIELAPGERLSVGDLYLSTSQLEIVVQLNEVAEIAELDALFRFRGCDPLDDKGMALLSRLQGLESLRIDSLRDVTDRGFRLLKHLPHLRRLELAGFKKVTPAGWSVIPTIRTLEELVFYRTPSLTAADILGLSSLPRLRVLELEKLPDCALVSLASCPALEDLSVSKSGVRLLLGSLSGAQKLRRLGLRRCWGLDSSSLSELCNSSDLEELEFDGCPLLTDAALSKLASMPRLKKLTLEDCGAVRGEFLAAFHNHGS
ncbi:partial Internalin I, partial [Planctomycetaceae bacterium]